MESDDTAAIATGTTVAIVAVLVAIILCCIAIIVWHQTKHKKEQ